MEKVPIEVKRFINKLRLYGTYKEEIPKLKEEIENVVYQMSGVKCADPSKEPTRTPPNMELWYKLSDKKESLESELRDMETLIKKCDVILDSLEEEIKKALIYVYVEDNSMFKASKKLGYTYNGLRGKIIRRLKKALN